jgi:hypothetical protein
LLSQSYRAAAWDEEVAPDCHPYGGADAQKLVPPLKSEH